MSNKEGTSKAALRRAWPLTAGSTVKLVDVS